MGEVTKLGDSIREAVFGANDGAVSTFGILSGLVGATLTSNIIVLVGFIQVFAAGLSMGLGAYISTKSQNEYYGAEENRQKRDIDVHPAREKARVNKILERRGLKSSALKEAAASVTRSKRVWLHFLVEERFGISETSYPNPVLAGTVMFIAFLIAGFLSLLAFIIIDDTQHALLLSALLSLLTLFGVGAAKTRFTLRNPWMSGLENLIVGALTGVIGYTVGAVVSSLV